MKPRQRNNLIISPADEQDALRHVTPEFPCPYLPDRLARNEAYQVSKLDGEKYEKLLARGFRRSGCIVYRPRCRNCHECRQLRVPVKSFRRTKSMNRVWRKNADVEAFVGLPRPTQNKYELFTRYLDAQHDRTMSPSRESFHEFLYASSTDTMEIAYRLDGRLLGVSLADACPGGLSSVYMFFDPDYHARSLGTYSVLWEIDYCLKNNLQQYYLGFFVAGSATMDYKARFRPNQVLAGEDRWITMRT